MKKGWGLAASDLPTPRPLQQRTTKSKLLWQPRCAGVLLVYKSPNAMLGPLAPSEYWAYLWAKQRSDERTRTADLISLRVSCSTVDCRARSFFLSSRQHYRAGATLGQQGAERDLRYFCSFASMPGSNSYGTSHASANGHTLNYPGYLGPPMPVLPLPPAPLPPWRRSVPSACCKCD